MKNTFIVLFMLVITMFISCGPSAEEIAAKAAADSARIADSIAFIEEIKQRYEDSVKYANEKKNMDTSQVSKKHKEISKIQSQASSSGGVEGAWDNILYQITIYQSFDGLPSSEKLEAFNKIISGYNQLQIDIEYFLAYASFDDNRRPVVERFNEVMKNVRNK